jgi:phosphoserine aminotransferase
MQAGASAQFSAIPLNFVAHWIEKRRQKAAAELGDNEAAILERVKHEFTNEYKMDYLVTGSWSLKASQEAALLFAPLGKQFVNVALDARQASDGKFRSIPSESQWKLTSNGSAHQPAFVYYCDNETVDGVEFPTYPQILEDTLKTDGGPDIVADMSSNILSRPVNVAKYGAIFFGAQKNISSAGLTVA